MVQSVTRAIRSLFPATDAAPKSKGPGYLVIPHEVRASVEGDHLVFLHIGQGVVYKSNSTGTRIWRGLMEQKPAEAIAEQLSREFGVPRDQVERHVTNFV